MKWNKKNLRLFAGGFSLGSGRNGGQIAQIVVFAAVGDGFEIFRIASMGDAHSGDLPLLCHVDCLLLFHNGIVGKLIPGDSAALFHKTNDSLCVGIRLRNLIQCIFDEIMIFHFCITPFGNSIYTVRSWYAINKEKGCGGNPRSPKEHDSEVVRQKTLGSCVEICILLYKSKVGC